jgi:hypothetical protein
MKYRFLAGLLALALTSPSFAIADDNPTAPAAPSQTANQNAKPAPTGFVLEDGTPMKLRLTRNLSSGSDRMGDQVDFEVLEDLSVDNVLVVPRGAVALATITEAEPERRMGRGGKLDVNIDSVRLRDGERAALRAGKEGKGGGHVGAMTGAMVGTAIVFFPAAPLFLFMHGKDINIPKGTEITAYVDGNVQLDRAKFVEKAQAAPQQQTAPATTPESQGTLAISSTPAGADVEVDGSFMGNTPSQLNLAAGDHTIKVSKTGFKPWQRKLKISGGSINLNAELEQDANKQPAAEVPKP